MNTIETMKPTREITVQAHPEDIKVVKLFSSGLNVPQISERMGVNQRTLEKKVLVLKKAYNVNTIAELVAFFMSKNLIRYKKR